MNQRICLGQIVQVRRGRKTGQYAIVIDNTESRMVWLADGKDRPFDRPKRKNVRHIQPTQYIVKGIANQLQNHGSVTNAQLRNALNQYLLEQKGE